MTNDEAETIAIDMLGYLAKDEVRLERFLALTGISMDVLRAAAREPAFLAGVVAHISGDERTLMDFAEKTGHPPEAASAALHSLGGARPGSHGDN